MSLIKWNPEVSLMPKFSSWMDDFFSDNGDWMKPAFAGISVPAVNVTENKTSFKLEVAAPGFKKDDFKIEVNNGIMTISGETKQEATDKDEQYTRREFSYSKFSRSFTLPENVKSDNITAKFDDGILRIGLPKTKTEEKAAKTISIG